MSAANMQEQSLPMEVVAKAVDLQPQHLSVAPQARVKAVDRSQLLFKVVDVERLIEEDHPARAIWEFVGKLDLRAFYADIAAVEGVAGREAWDPRVLISVCIYAYSRGIGSAREVSRRCAYEPAFQWLAGLGVINYHSLSDFRVDYDQDLQELFQQVLGVLTAQGLVSLQRVMQDGTKIKACASTQSFRRQGRLQQCLQAAREQVQAMGDPCVDQPQRQKAAALRAARERQERVHKALEELKKIQQSKPSQQEKEAARASSSDPEARNMKQADGGFSPSYNVQLTTDAKHKIVVGTAVSQSANDYAQLLPAMQRLEQTQAKKPEQTVADTGYTTRENIAQMAAAGIDFIGSFRDSEKAAAAELKKHGVSPQFYPHAFSYHAEQDSYRCPAGQSLHHRLERHRRGRLEHGYEADSKVCAACPFKPQCCPRVESRRITRIVEGPEVEEFLAKMASDASKNIYRQRSEVAEFPNAWIKQKLGLRQFRLRGSLKVHLEVLWAALTYNIQQWIRLCWRPSQTAAA